MKNLSIKMISKSTIFIIAILVTSFSGFAQICDVPSITIDNLSECSDNGTPEDPSDDFFTADVTASFNLP